MLKYLLLVALCAVVANCELKTPCAGLFEYTKQDETGRWEGVLNIKSEYTLHGVWIRIFLDGAVSDVKLLETQGEVKKTDGDSKVKDFLIKNRDLLLKKDEPATIKFSVAYEGKNPPAFAGFRLNARTLCPVGEE
ncbi:PREDICTED: uncharacterized protein LOC108559656 [Nicrophorus vespilloides]|uniref:Uncharacterized protein LOC108559656 n=1 Tax=Nicrophorus vespilloides TaxID=110193 RepID=A0ABM1MD44_NICVS|nr:PREDICTED: uncharacterized protein LOC108559656 [Nicrophorus vespilloides]